MARTPPAGDGQLIEFRDVSKSFDGGATYALQDLSLQVDASETLVLLGSSGSGKTTALRTVNRLVAPTSGRVLLDGVDVRELDPIALRRSVGYVFQGVGLFPHLTVGENVELVPRALGWSAERRARRREELLEMVGLPLDLAARMPGELSGGQQQRVGVARALAARPRYLLMDEPFGALDAVTRDRLQREMTSFFQALERAVVFVTHDIYEALALGDRIAVLHEGRLHQVGTGRELARSPATDFVGALFERPARQVRAYREIAG